MNFVPINPVEAVLAEVLAAIASPAWIVDADRGLLVAGNGRGDAVWGIPVMAPALDNATIPLLKGLRIQLAGRPSASSRFPANVAVKEAVRFWTCNGARNVPCNIQLLDESVGRGLLLIVMEAGASPAPVASDSEASFDERAFVERWLATAGGSARPASGAATRSPMPAADRANVPLSDSDTLREIARRIRQGSAGMPGDGDLATDLSVRGLDVPPSPHREARSAAPHDPAANIDVSAHLAHEIRTPLAAIISLAEVITEERLGPWPNERYRTYISDILDSARHGLEVVDGILSEAPGEAVPRPMTAEVDLNVEVEALCASLQPLAEKSGARLEAALVSGLPRVAADRRNIRQMLLNLVSNALKHGGASVRIKVTTGYELGGEVWFEVEDDGPGMAASHANGGGHAARGAAPERGTRKAGLGLPLTRSLATANGARLDVSSRPGRGVRARIVFDGAGSVSARG